MENYLERETSLSDAPDTKPAWYRLATWLAGIIVLGYIVAPPWSLEGKINLVGYGICHQLAEHSYIIGGHQLPLCARCTGTYFGILLGFTAIQLLRRHRAAELPPVRVIIVLLGFIGIMGLDGINSYLDFYPTINSPYAPRNYLRLATGILNGITMITLVYPIFNFTLWKNPTKSRVLTNLREVGALVLAAVPIILFVEADCAWAYYPLALLSAGGVLFMLAAINTVIITVMMRRENMAENWRDVLNQLLFGLVLALGELTFMGVVRVVLTKALGLDF